MGFQLSKSHLSLSPKEPLPNPINNVTPLLILKNPHFLQTLEINLQIPNKPRPAHKIIRLTLLHNRLNLAHKKTNKKQPIITPKAKLLHDKFR